MATVFNQQNRVAGSYSSPEINTNPQTMVNRTFTAACTNLSAAFLANVANTISLVLMGGYIQPDTTVVWRELNRLNWTGAVRDRSGGAVNPAISYTTTNDLPDKARLDMTLGQTTNCGVDLTLS